MTSRGSEMTIQDVIDRVSSIREHAQRGDNEVAHIEEDQLLRDFVAFVAKEQGPLADLARAVGEVMSLSYQRWYS
jgi:hypothetical protein